MTDQEYRQDDRTDTGYCPKCGASVTTVFVDGAGWCPDHGRVWCDWTPRVPPAVSDEYDEGPIDPYRRASVGDASESERSATQMTEILDSQGNRIEKGMRTLDDNGQPDGIVLDVTDPDGDVNEYGRPVAYGPFVFVSYDDSTEIIRYTAHWNATGPWDDHRDDYTCDDLTVAPEGDLL